MFRRETRVLVEKSKIPVAAIISAQDLERLTRFDEQRKKDFAILDEIRAVFQDISSDEVEREVARAIQKGREANSLPHQRPASIP